MRKPCDTAEGQSLKIAGPSKRMCLFGCVGVQEEVAPVEAKLDCLHCDKIRGVLGRWHDHPLNNRRTTLKTMLRTRSWQVNMIALQAVMDPNCVFGYFFLLQSCYLLANSGSCVVVKM
jgi:hypothetical protein